MTISIISICTAAVLITAIVCAKDYITDRDRRKEEKSANAWREECHALRSVYDRIDNLISNSSIVLTEEQKEKLKDLFEEADDI